MSLSRLRVVLHNINNRLLPLSSSQFIIPLDVNVTRRDNSIVAAATASSKEGHTVIYRHHHLRSSRAAIPGRVDTCHSNNSFPRLQQQQLTTTAIMADEKSGSTAAAAVSAAACTATTTTTTTTTPIAVAASTTPAESDAVAATAPPPATEGSDGDPKDNSGDEGSAGNNNNNNNKSNRQRKNSKWKQNWKDKKKNGNNNNNKRQNSQNRDDKDGDSKRAKSMVAWKKDYDDVKDLPPHEGSFAHDEMRRLFDVAIDNDGMPTCPTAGGEKGDGRKTATADGEEKPIAREAAEDDAKRGGGETTTTSAAEGVVAIISPAVASSSNSSNSKVPKKKLAMLVSFLGTDYGGFQINSRMRTLHAELELALHRAGIISSSNFGHPKKYGWSNSARTDKGVHAAAQVCSFKGEMIYHDIKFDEVEGEGQGRDQFDAMREATNRRLPSDVRVLDFGLVTRGFCARTNRDKVRYQYMVPSYLLCSEEEVRKAFADALSDGGEHVARLSRESKAMTPKEASDAVLETIDPEALEKARDALIGHRVSDEQMDRLRDGLRLFEGTHSFHNYTRRVGAGDANAARYILSFRPLEPITVPAVVGGGADGSDGKARRPETQWIPLQIVGQSFLLNQIRKMVSAAVDLARGTTDAETIRRSLTRQCVRMKVNVAPAQGLFLDRSYFELYNKHKVENAPKRKKDDVGAPRETLDWVEAEGSEMPAAVRRIEEFKNEKIIPHIVSEESREGNFLKYLYAQDVLYADRMYRSIDDDDDNGADEK